jgi:AcrR family transcriptional regulator
MPHAGPSRNSLLVTGDPVSGDGQGSLYRHFPDRTSLALAAFEENVSLLEGFAARPDSTLDECLELLSDPGDHLGGSTRHLNA